MRLRKASLVAVLAASMASTPVMAQVAESSLPTVQSARSGAGMTDANEMRGGWFIPLIAILAIIAGILAATNSGGDRPHSP